MTASRLTARKRAADLDRFYTGLERDLHVTSNPTYELLVVPNGNGGKPVHRWFRLKEAFSLDLIPHILTELGLDEDEGLRVLDPFAGSGTTPIATAELVTQSRRGSAYVLGYECNPFLHLVASTKLRALQTPSLSFLGVAKRIAATAARGKVDPAPKPELSAFNNDQYFEQDVLDKLLRLRAAIEQVATRGASELDVDLARVCLGATVEPVSRLRRDGRALRYVPDKQRPDVILEFLRRAEQIDDDLQRPPLRVRGRIQLGDGRLLAPRPPEKASIDVILFSPPYPNNIDYTEVYKLEAWLLGFINSHEEFATQRLKTLYSHPSLLRETLATPDDGSSVVAPLIAPLIAVVPDDRYRTARKSMITGYASDMLTTLHSCYRALRPGGHLVYVVGNSLHGGGDNCFVLAADLLIARLAIAVGFDVTSVEIARSLQRRRHASPYLRESVVFARKPTA